GGSTWTAFGSPSVSAALLLAADANTYVRFVPNVNWNGTVTNGIVFRAWDQTSGTAGGTADFNNYLDQFCSVSYSNNNGTASFASSWTESGDDNNANSGDILISGGQLNIKSNKVGEYLSRQANLSGLTSARLSFDYNNTLNTKAGNTDQIVV